MNQNKAILILLGIGIILGFLASYLWSNSLLDIFNMSIGIMVLILGFYNDNKEINCLIALSCVNIFQWIILSYIFFNNIYIKTEFYYYLIGTLLFTIVLANQIRNNQKTGLKILKGKTKLILLFTGLIIIISCLVGFIAYHSFVALYGITLGLISLICGYYYEDKKLNVSANYAKVMGFVLILQWLIFIFFFRQFSGEDLVNAVSFSMMITLYFLIQVRNVSLISISNKKKEMIVVISAIILFIALIFGIFYMIGNNQSNTKNGTIISNYSITDVSYKSNMNIPVQSFSGSGISFNYPSGWFIYSQGNMVIITKDLDNKEVKSQIEIKPNNGMSEEDAIKQSQGSFMSGKPDASYKLTIDNKTAYEDIYTYEDDKLMKFAQIILVKNDKTYLMYLQAADEDFDKEKSNFAVILNSFKVQ